MSSGEEAIAAVLARLAMAFDGAILGAIVATFAAHAWSAYAFSSRALEKIRSAPSPRISDLRSLLSPEDARQGLLVVVRGAVQEKDHPSLISHGSGEKAVVIQRVQTCLYNDLRGVFGLNFDLYTLFARKRKEQQSFTMRSVPFILTEGGSWPYKEYVDVKISGSSHQLPLTTSLHQMLPFPASSSSFIHALFGRGIPVAILDEEKILPTGKHITAIGIGKLENEVLEIHPSKDLPCFLSYKTKNEIEADITFDTGVFFWTGVILGSVSVGIVGYSIIRNWWRWRAWRLGRRHRESDDINREEPGLRGDNEEIHMSDGDNEMGDIPNGELCVICLCRRRRSAFIPCGHRACCPRCTSMVVQELSPKCPLCRQSVHSSVRIYDT